MMSFAGSEASRLAAAGSFAARNVDLRRLQQSEPPEYMKLREIEAYLDFNSYRSGLLLQQRLLAAVDARRARQHAG
jgi:hypothetical protein